MDFRSRRFQAVTAVVVVALIAGTFAYYTTTGGVTSTSTVKSTPSTEVSFPSTSGGSSGTSQTVSTNSQKTLTVVSSTTIPCTSGVGAGATGTSTTTATSLPDFIPLFSTVSAMTMLAQQVIVDQYGRVNSTTILASYQVTGRVPMEGTSAYVVKMSVAANQTSYAVVNGTSNQGNATAYFDPEGDLLLYTQTNLNQTGPAAIPLAALYLDWFDNELISTQQLASYANPGLDSNLNTTAVNLGPTSMNVTFAQPKAIPYSVTQCGGTTIVEDVLFAYGVVPGTQTPVITYYYSIGTDGGANEDLGYESFSITPA